MGLQVQEQEPEEVAVHQEEVEEDHQGLRVREQEGRRSGREGRGSTYSDRTGLQPSCTTA